jgi:hypothetical protein
MWEKQQTTTLPSVLRGMQSRREELIVFQFKILYSGSDVSVVRSKVTLAP